MRETQGAAIIVPCGRSKDQQKLRCSAGGLFMLAPHRGMDHRPVPAALGQTPVLGEDSRDRLAPHAEPCEKDPA